jgi:hypothetical protein
VARGEKGKRVGGGGRGQFAAEGGGTVAGAYGGRFLGRTGKSREGGLVRGREKKLTGATLGSGAQLQRENPLTHGPSQEKQTNKIRIKTDPNLTLSITGLPGLKKFQLKYGDVGFELMNSFHYSNISRFEKESKLKFREVKLG